MSIERMATEHIAASLPLNESQAGAVVSVEGANGRALMFDVTERQARTLLADLRDVVRWWDLKALEYGVIGTSPKVHMRHPGKSTTLCGKAIGVTWLGRSLGSPNQCLRCDNAV